MDQIKQIIVNLPFNTAMFSTVTALMLTLLFFIMYMALRKDKSKYSVMNRDEIKYIMLMSFFFFIYTTAEPIVVISANLRFTVIVTRVELSLTLFAMYFFLRLIFVYTKEEATKKAKWVPTVFLIYSFILSYFMIFTPGLVTNKELEFLRYGWVVEMGPLFNFVYTPTLLFIIVYGLVKLLQARRKIKHDKVEATRLTLIIIGISMTMLFSAIEVAKAIISTLSDLGDASVIGITIMSLMIGISTFYKYFHTQKEIVDNENKLSNIVHSLKESSNKGQNTLQMFSETSEEYKSNAQGISTVAKENEDINTHTREITSDYKNQVKNFSTMVIGNITTFEEILSSLVIQNFKIENFFNIIKEMIKTMDEIAEKGKIVSGGVVNLSSVISDAKKNSQANSEYMNEVKKRIDSIYSINLTIEKISEQSNTLSMNAAIEAANSGEIGYGFRVVSNDLRELAVRTKEETDKIEKILSTLRDDLVAGIESAESVRDFFGELEITIENIFNFILKIVNQTKDLLLQTDESENYIKSLLTIAEESSKQGKEQQELNNELNDSIINVKYVLESVRRAVEEEQLTLDTVVGMSRFILDKSSLNKEFAEHLNSIFDRLNQSLDKGIVETDLQESTAVTLKD